MNWGSQNATNHDRKRVLSWLLALRLVGFDEEENVVPVRGRELG